MKTTANKPGTNVIKPKVLNATFFESVKPYINKKPNKIKPNAKPKAKRAATNFSGDKTKGSKGIKAVKPEKYKIEEKYFTI